MLGARCSLDLAVLGILEDDLQPFSHHVSMNDYTP